MWTGVFSQKMRWIRETILDQINFKKIPSRASFNLGGINNLWKPISEIRLIYLRRINTHLLSV